MDIKELLEGVYAPNTVNNYAYTWDVYYQWCKGKRHNPYTAQALIAYRQYCITERKLAASSINNYVKVIKTIVRELATAGKITKDAAFDMHRVRLLPRGSLRDRKPEHSRTWLSPEQVRSIIDAAEPNRHQPTTLRNRALLLTLATTGARVSEVISMRSKDLVERDGHYFVENVWGKKQGEPRTVPISAEAYEAILDWLNFRPINSYFIFSHVAWHDNDGEIEILYNERHISRQEAHRVVCEYADKAGVPHVKPHDFRRFVATQLAQKDLRTAQVTLGHRNINTTTIYLPKTVPAGVTENLF